MTNCRQSSELSSQSLDRKLSIRQWLALHIHIGLCPFCKRFGEHIAILRGICNHFGERAHEHDFMEGMSDEAKQRIKQALKTRN